MNNIANGIIVGNQLLTPGSTPVFNLIGGITNVTGPLAFSNTAPNNGQLLTANITGGVLNVTGVQTIVSAANNSVLNITGSAVINDTGNLAGPGVAGASSVINISGTSVFNNTGGAVSFLVGNGGNVATVNQTGGTARFTAGLQVTGSGNGSVQTGTYNLSGGTLATLTLTGNATNASSTSTVNLNGGTLQALGNTATFVTGMTAANVLPGGAIIDSQAFAVTVPQNLSSGSPSDGGLTKLGTGSVTLTGVNTYVGGNNVSNGTLEVANVGSLGSLTSPAGNRVGSGGTLTLDVGGALFTAGNVDSVRASTTFSGGSFLGLNTAAGAFTYGTTITGPQGLVVTGTKALTVAANNAYTGPTNIAGGSQLVASTLANGGLPSSVGASNNASGNLILNGTVGNGNDAANPTAGATLVYTGPTQSTDRGFTLSGATAQNTINVSNASTVLTFAGQPVLSVNNNVRFFKQGPGTLAFTNAGTNTFTTTAANVNAIVASGTMVLGAPGQIDNFALLSVGSVISPNASSGSPNLATLNIIDGVVNTTVVGGYFAVGNNVTIGTLNQVLTANVTGGVLNTPNVYTLFNANQTTVARLNLSGGAINATGTFQGVNSGGVAGSTSDGTSIVNISGGLFNVGSGAAGNTASYVTAGTGNGTVNQTGGTFALVGPLGLAANATTSIGTYNLAGGVLSTSNVFKGNGTGTFNFNGGTLQANNNSAGFLTATTANVLAGGGVIDTQAFNVSIGQNISSGVAGPAVDGGLTKIGTGTLTFAANQTYTGVTNASVGTITFPAANAGSGIAVRRLPGGVYAGANGTVVLPTSTASADRTLLVTGPVGTAPTGRIDLGNGDLISTNGNLAAVTALAAQGYAGGAFNASGGLTSSVAAADTNHLTAVGVIPNTADGINPLFTSFDGQPVSAADVLARFTYYGDTNLDGSVNAADFTRIDVGFVNGRTGWLNGDFNYDGVVDGSDYSLADNAFNQQTGAINPALALGGSLVAAPTAAVAAVPEPATVGVLAVVLAAGLGRRRRRSA